MALTDPLVLPADVVVTPVRELSSALRRQMAADESDYAVSRPRSRTGSKIVDAQMAALLLEFREPRTIVEAVIRYSRSKRLEPEKTLEDALPALHPFIRARLLVPAGSKDASLIVETYPPGAQAAGYEIVRCIQVLEDSELYQVRADGGQEAALKIARPGRERSLRRALAREAEVLRRLPATVSAPLLSNGVFEGRPYLAMGWCPGVSVTSAAHELRQQYGSGPTAWSHLRDLGAAVLQAYARLHEQGLIHGDIHPGNLLVDANGPVRIVDFGLARFERGGRAHGAPRRGGVAFFFEPEFAKARLRRRHLPLSTFAGEQYALGSLLYLLLTGRHYLEFSAEKDEMLRQIAEDPPLSLARAQVLWPEMEAVIGRALRKDPGERFPSVAEFARQVQAVEAPASMAGATVAPQPAPLDRSAADALLEEVMGWAGPGGRLFTQGFPTAPYCSVNYGMAGLAYALYRIAGQRGDPGLLALADIWATRACARMGGEEAFYNTQIDITPGTVGSVALYHSATGVHAVQAIVAGAMGDLVSQQAAMDAFTAAAVGPCDNLDLTLGRSGILIGGSLLADLPAEADWLNRQPLLAAGHELLASVWRELDAMGPINAEARLRYLGIAHGWAGILYATLRWCTSTGTPLPGALESRLRELAAWAEPAGRGARWRVRLSRPGRSRRSEVSEPVTSWCNGSAGYVFLWTMAHRVMGDEAYLRLAEGAAEDAWERAIDFDSLCCGLAGSAYAFLSLHRHTGERVWLRRAEDLANRALGVTRRSDLPHSLYKGTLGVAVLVADLHDPENAAMPLFEGEGWPSRHLPVRPT